MMRVPDGQVGATPLHSVSWVDAVDLTCLRDCGIVVAEPEGRQTRYEIADSTSRRH